MEQKKISVEKKESCVLKGISTVWGFLWVNRFLEEKENVVEKVKRKEVEDKLQKVLK